MDQRKEFLVGLKDFLGNGAAGVIRERIIKNQGLDFSISYINMVLDTEDPRYNEIIVREALDYGKEKRAEQDKLANEVKSIVGSTKSL